MKPFYEQNVLPVQLKMVTERTFPVHIHPQVELMVVFEGEQEVEINGETCLARPGDLTITFPNLVHSLRERGEGPVHAPLMIFSPEVIGDLTHTFLSQLPLHPLLRLGEGEFQDLKELIIRLYSTGMGEGRELAVKGYLHIILSYIMGRLDLQDRSSGPRAQLGSTLLEVIDYVSEHFAEPLTLDSVAAALSISSIYLSHIYSSQLKLNFRSYINALRISYAQSLLKSSDLPVTDICFNCGYNNQKTFNRAFKEICGTTPTLYRARPELQRL